MGFVEELREALDDKDIDILDMAHIKPQSRIAEEIKQTEIEIMRNKIIVDKMLRYAAKICTLRRACSISANSGN